MRPGSAVVIGGGVAGLATARGLVGAGWEVRLFDRGEPEPRLDTAFGLWPAAWSVLERLGAAAAVDAVAERPEGAALLDPSGRVLIRPKRAPDVRLAPRTCVIDALRAGLPAEVCELRDVRPASIHQVDLLVGADGINSAVRTLITPVAPRPVGSVAWRGTLASSPALPAETWGDGLLFGVTPGGVGRTNWFACAPTKRAGSRAADRVVALRELFGGWHQGVTAVLDRLEESRIDRRTLMEVPHLRSLVSIPPARPVVALVGDAAHAMAPNLGRGACEGLLDALALVDAVVGAADLPEALHRYDRRRRQRGAAVRSASRVINTISTTRTGWRARNRVFALVGRLV